MKIIYNLLKSLFIVVLLLNIFSLQSFNSRYLKSHSKNSNIEDNTDNDIKDFVEFFNKDVNKDISNKDEIIKINTELLNSKIDKYRSMQSNKMFQQNSSCKILVKNLRSLINFNTNFNFIKYFDKAVENIVDINILYHKKINKKSLSNKIFVKDIEKKKILLLINEFVLSLKVATRGFILGSLFISDDTIRNLTQVVTKLIECAKESLKAIKVIDESNIKLDCIIPYLKKIVENYFLNQKKNAAFRKYSGYFGAIKSINSFRYLDFRLM